MTSIVTGDFVHLKDLKETFFCHIPRASVPKRLRKKVDRAKFSQLDKFLRNTSGFAFVLFLRNS